MEKKVRLRIEKTLPAYTRLRGVSWYAFKLAQDSLEGRIHHLMTSMLFCAFTLEAFLNHVGQIKFPFWETLKERLSPRDKLNVLECVLPFGSDFGKRPFQTFRSIFRFRNLLVHAKTETLITEGDFILSEGEGFPQPLTEWEQLLTIDHARIFLDDTKEIVTLIAEAAGINPNEVFELEKVKAESVVLSDITKPSS